MTHQATTVPVRTRQRDRLPPAAFRADIQALRAIAVAFVVIYHVWPTVLPGGYVGVDVFFVISGFLITAHLRQQAEGPRGLSLMGFYTRRIRRLLPASLLVLLVSTVGILLWIPRSHWPINLGAVTASTFYVENWFLAATSTDYLSGSVAASNPVQHYWSLSTEEQFYLIWPLLILVSTAVALRTGRRHLTLAFLAVVTAVSFVVSVAWSAADPSVAYFATPTRAWEFGFGALLTFVPRFGASGRARRAVIGAVWLGLALMLTSALSFGEVTEFPGWIALVPVVGAGLVIAADQPRGRFSLQPAADLAPIQRIGDWSYAIYLWHWPLLIFAGLVLADGSLGTPGKIAVVAMTLVLAGLTRKYVERPFIRGGRGRAPRAPARRREIATLAAAAAGMLAVMLVAWPPLATVEAEATTQRDAIAAIEAAPPACFGAAALTDPSCVSSPPPDAFVPGLLIAGSDQSALDGCQSAPHTPRHCEFGPEDGTPVALVGDSHTSQWLIAVESAAEAYGWRVTTYLAGACPLFAPEPGLPQSIIRGCPTWQEETLTELVRNPYPYVIVSAQAWDALDRVSYDPNSPEFDTIATQVAAEYAVAWSSLADAGSQVLVIADTPSPTLAGVGDLAGCIEIRGPTECDLARSPALASTAALAIAVRDAPSARMVDFTDILCPGTADCPAIVGGVLVWADSSHLTKTYVRTLAPTFITRIGSAAGVSDVGD